MLTPHNLTSAEGTATFIVALMGSDYDRALLFAAELRRVHGAYYFHGSDQSPARPFWEQVHNVIENRVRVLAGRGRE